MFKIIKGKVPNYLTMLFSNCNNINYQLRSNNLKISLPKPKTYFLKKSFAYRGAASWNKLPSDILREIDEYVILFEYFLINFFILKFNAVTCN